MNWRKAFFGILFALVAPLSCYTAEVSPLKISARHLRTSSGDCIEFVTENISKTTVAIEGYNVAGAYSFSTKIAGTGGGPFPIDLPRVYGLADPATGMVELSPGESVKRRVGLNSNFPEYRKWEKRRGMYFVFVWLWDNVSVRKNKFGPQSGTVIIDKR